MVPSSYTRLEKIPLTANGKLDKKALLAPELEAGVSGEIIRESTEKILSGVQEKLIRIWSEVLGINKNQLGLNSNFFELGGHSLSIVTVKNKIKEQFNCTLSVVDMFRLPTIASMEKMLLEKDQGIAALANTVDSNLKDANQNLELLEGLLAEETN
jgi:acyl carrier protein